MCGLNGVKTVGAGLLANAVDQPMNELTDTPHSRASPLPHLDLHVFRWNCGLRFSKVSRRYRSNGYALKNIIYMYKKIHK
jgi:hypothetical protein